MKYLFIYLFAILYSNKVFSQNFKNQNFNKIKIQLSLITGNKEYLLIELAEKKIFVIIKENDTKYLNLVYLIEPNGYLLNEISYLNKCEKLFEINNYKKGFIDSESPAPARILSCGSK